MELKVTNCGAFEPSTEVTEARDAQWDKLPDAPVEEKKTKKKDK